MDIKNYIGLRYDIFNKRGVNCWGLYALVMHNEKGVMLDKRNVENASTEAIAAGFSALFACNEFNKTHKEVTEPEDFDLVIFSKANKHHCGIMYKGKLLHSRGSGRTGQVYYENLSSYDDWKKRFYRYED